MNSLPATIAFAAAALLAILQEFAAAVPRAHVWFLTPLGPWSVATVLLAARSGGIAAPGGDAGLLWVRRCLRAVGRKVFSLWLPIVVLVALTFPWGHSAQSTILLLQVLRPHLVGSGVSLLMLMASLALVWIAAEHRLPAGTLLRKALWLDTMLAAASVALPAREAMAISIAWLLVRFVLFYAYGMAWDIRGRLGLPPAALRDCFAATAAAIARVDPRFVDLLGRVRKESGVWEGFIWGGLGVALAIAVYFEVPTILHGAGMLVLAIGLFRFAYRSLDPLRKMRLDGVLTELLLTEVRTGDILFAQASIQAWRLLRVWLLVNAIPYIILAIDPSSGRDIAAWHAATSLAVLAFLLLQGPLMEAAMRHRTLAVGFIRSMARVLRDQGLTLGMALFALIIFGHDGYGNETEATMVAIALCQTFFLATIAACWGRLFLDFEGYAHGTAEA